MITTEPSSHNSKIFTLCEACANAVAQRCAFIRASDPEKALATIGATATKHPYTYGKKSAATYRVRECPSYTTGGLPVIPELKVGVNQTKGVPAKTEREYDLSCPNCGRVDTVKIASMQSLPPEQWYCRCGVCNKSFKPRRKGIKLTPFETAPHPGKEPRKGRTKNGEPCENRQKFEAAMTKELYLEGVGKGWSDYKILKVSGLGYQKYKKFLRQAKRDWELGENFNLKLREGKTVELEPNKGEGETVKTDEPTVQAKEEYTINQLIDLRDDLEGEVENLDALLDTESGVKIVTGVKLLLENYRCEQARKLKRIHDAFVSVKVAI